jgi:aspartate aminotransferase
MAQQGVDVINLAGGDPDFDTPAHITDAAVASLRAGFTHYVSSAGTPELRRAIADKLRQDNALDYDPASDIIVTPGGKLGLYAAILATVEEGDEVLILDPAWVSYVPCVQLAGAAAVYAGLSSGDNFRVTADKLQANISARCRLMIVNTPNNPTGRVLRNEELKAIAEVALANDLWVISDEIYEKLVFDGHEHVSIGSLPSMFERTITVSGLSKTYAMTGWRLGFAAAKGAMAKAILRVQQHSVTCASSFAQAAGVAALAGPQDLVRQMVDAYKERRDIITAGLSSLPGISCHSPEGAFYAFPDISGTGMSSLDFADHVLSQARVALTPGIAFGPSGEYHVRLSFAAATHLIEEAIERMRGVL